MTAEISMPIIDEYNRLLATKNPSEKQIKRLNEIALKRILRLTIPVWAKGEKEERAFVRDLFAESERGCVLVATAHIDKALESLLLFFFRGRSDIGEKRLLKMFDFRKQQSPLFGSLGAKTMVAHAIGLIDGRIVASLDSIRELRNKFAHHPGRVTIGQFPLPSFPDPKGDLVLNGVRQATQALTEMAAHVCAPRLSKSRVHFMQTAAMVHGFIKMSEDACKRGEFPFQSHSSE